MINIFSLVTGDNERGNDCGHWGDHCFGRSQVATGGQMECNLENLEGAGQFAMVNACIIRESI